MDPSEGGGGALLYSLEATTVSKNNISKAFNDEHGDGDDNQDQVVAKE
jgi:hypothetical protein